MKTREELLRSKGYWTAQIQTDLFREVEEYMKKNNLKRTQLAEKLGCSKGYVTQLLSGDYDNKISKLVELALAIGKVPQITYKEVDDVIKLDTFKLKITVQPYAMTKYDNSHNSLINNSLAS